MKTDKEKLTELLTSFGVEWREKTGYSKDDSHSQIKVGGNRKYSKVDGYNGFYTIFDFDEDGKFVVIGAWE